MSGRTGSGSSGRGCGRRGQGGYVTVYFAVVATLVLIPLVLAVIDLLTLAYYRTKLRNTADALAIAAVAESSSWHIPIPTKFAGLVPVDGFMINGIHLSNLETRIGWETPPGPKLKELAGLNVDRQGQGAKVEVQAATVMPLGNLVSPFMYVKVPVRAEVRLNTPYLAPLLGGNGNGVLEMKAEACALAWYRVDRWVRGWWTPDEDGIPHALDLALQYAIGKGGEPQKFYRLVNCVEDWSDVAALVESVVTEQVRLQTGRRVGDLQEILGDEASRWLTDWIENRGTNRELKKARQEFTRETGFPQACRKGTSCVSEGKEDEWIEAVTEAKRAEEAAARKAAEAAARAEQRADGDAP